MATVPTIAFVWDNFGPLHVDRCNAVGRALAGRVRIIGLELFGNSEIYDWDRPEAEAFEKHTLFEDGSWTSLSPVSIARAIVHQVMRANCRTVFLCHYERRCMIYTSFWLRLAGLDVFTMGCSKADDRPRSAWREWTKRLLLSAYLGAIGSEHRSTAYFRSLGLAPERVVGGYNTVDHARLRDSAAEPRAHLTFDERPFVAVARLAQEKDYPMLLRAYADYVERVEQPRRLQIAGSGPLQDALRASAERLGVSSRVDWLGFLQSPQIGRLMGEALCLVLPSKAEPFGNVVAEALAFDLPVLATSQCGAAGYLVRDDFNGMTFRSGDHARLTELMVQIGSDEALWQRWRSGSRELAALADSARFAEAVTALAAPA